jgi:stage V sporulation protein S
MRALEEMNVFGTPEVTGDSAFLAPSDDPLVDQPHPQRQAEVASPSGVEVLKVSTRSRPSAVAGAIAGVLRQRDHVEVQSIGAGATNQAIKAIAIARTYLRDDGFELGCVPFFMDVAIDGEDRTALRLLIQRFPARSDV